MESKNQMENLYMEDIDNSIDDVKIQEIERRLQQTTLDENQHYSANNFEDSDEENPYIQKMLEEDQQLKSMSYEKLIEERDDRKSKYLIKMKAMQETNERKWLRDHGKKQYIDFEEDERKQLKKYFQSLDKDTSGGIGQEELEGPLISLGIAESREEVKKIIDSVDDDGNIEFKEFLIIIKGKEKKKQGQPKVSNQNNQKNQAIVKFFKNMTIGKLGDGTIPKSLPFELIISQQRRKKFMAAIMDEKGTSNQVEGDRVMKAWEKLQAQTNSSFLKKNRSQRLPQSMSKGSIN